MAAQTNTANTDLNYKALTTQFPANVRAWLGSKFVEPEYRRQGNIFWNEEGQELVFPIHDEDGKLVFTCNRYFGTDKSHPRYINRGSNEDTILLLGDKDADVVFIVEDYISALRIGTSKSRELYNPPLRFVAHPMFGSKPNHEHMLELSQKYLGCIFFMDPDMHQEAQEYCYRYSQYFHASGWVHAGKDPKDFSPPDLNKILTSHVQQMELRLFTDPLYKSDKSSEAKSTMEEPVVSTLPRKVWVPSDEDERWPQEYNGE